MTEVWILEEVFPYDDTQIVGVFTSAMAAMEWAPTSKPWLPVETDKDSFTTAPQGGTIDPYHFLSKWEVES